MALLVGGLEWLVGAWGIMTNIPLPTSRGPVSGQELGICGHCSPPMNLHGPMEGSGTGSPSWVASQSALHTDDMHVPLGCPPISGHAQGGP